MKKILAFILASFLLVSLCACGDKGDDTSSETLISVGKTEQVEVKAAENVFPENTVVEIKTIKEGDDFKKVDTALKEVATKFEVYDITAKSENVAVQPNGTVKATFDVPENFDIDKAAVVYVSDDGKVESLPCTIDKDQKTVTAQLSHFSFYAVIEKIEADVQSTVKEESSSNAVSETEKPTESSKPAQNDKIESNKAPVVTLPVVSSEPAHTHTFSEATCTTAKKCACGVTEGKALGHSYIDDKCQRCGAIDSTYKALLSGHWTVEAVSDNTLYDYSFVFSGQEPFCSIGVGDNIKTLPEEFQNEIRNNPADYADSIHKFGNETYYIGQGGGDGITFEVDKNIVKITIGSSATITIERTAGDKYTVISSSGDTALKPGAVLTWEKAEIAED